ncbi:hypothetical protein EAL2_c21170 [Peptoclostridium acidaminophilum DSM 3953]|uniref:Phosphohistidine phosphatase SixA n=1 Tax=Peptoclostridium acidaminophilum DSM 3953 TaxID=1286171 RepID=W8THS9_PEPAC|nr:histidine phosphatase family protein [Peptoclostridium acidaminophilum]AHM57398.1 hypothetical protein EAL2_c21170 [Peptoclostridium acidaminophilum DSM 3953]
MKIILVRHAKAQERGSTEDDSKRNLVEKGYNQAEKAARQLKHIIEHCGNTYIWSSPLARAWQTALVLEEELSIRYVQQMDFIAEGTAQDLIRNIKAVGSTDCLIIVGHEPYLGEWVSEITGESVEFKKCQIAVLEFKEGSYLKGSFKLLERE